jgi:hypothetical protein
MAKKDSIGKKAWDKAKYWSYGTGGTGLFLLEQALEKLGVGGGAGLFKDGGRVRGVGRAKRGFGRAMRKK